MEGKKEFERRREEVKDRQLDVETRVVLRRMEGMEVKLGELAAKYQDMLGGQQ